MKRRDFLQLTSASAAALGLSRLAQAASAQSAPAMDAQPDYTVRIGAGPIELAPDRFVSTTTYNGQFPGPLLRFKEGQRATVDIVNDTDTQEQLHWHGQRLPVEVDGAAEEGTPFIPPRGRRRISFVPGPAGYRFYHTHVRAGADLAQGQYSGQVGPVYIEPRNERGDYDREVFLVLKEFEPYFMRGGDMAMDQLAGTPEVKELKELGEKGERDAGKAPKGYEYPAGCTDNCLMSPVADLTPVAEAGKSAGRSFFTIAIMGGALGLPTATASFALDLGTNVGTGGAFDYQREGSWLSLSPWTQRREFRDVANFNVGLFSQQTGVLSLGATLTIAGVYAKHLSSNAAPSSPYGLDPRTAQWITNGFTVGASGVFGKSFRPW